MGYLRLVHSAPAAPPPESRCLEAFDRELDYLFETLQRLGAGPREVEDLAQEVFLVLHRNWPTLDLTRPLRPYLFGVAFRIVCAHRRRRARENSVFGPRCAGHRHQPRRVAAKQAIRRAVWAALERVPLPRRAVVVMHDLDGVPIADIARRMSISRFGAYARLRKARKELASAVRRLLKAGVRG